MKKVILIIIGVIVTVILAYYALRLIGLHIAFSKYIPNMTKGDLALCLHQNKDKFDNAAEIINKYPDILGVAGYNKYDKGNKEKFYYTTNNKLYIKSKNKLDNCTIKEVEYSSIKYIFDILKFESIISMEDCIYFIQGSNLAYANGIVYSPKKEKPEYEYLIELERIEDKWFYFRFR